MMLLLASMLNTTSGVTYHDTRVNGLASPRPLEHIDRHAVRELRTLQCDTWSQETTIANSRIAYIALCTNNVAISNG